MLCILVRSKPPLYALSSIKNEYIENGNISVVSLEFKASYNPLFTVRRNAFKLR